MRRGRAAWMAAVLGMLVAALPPGGCGRGGRDSDSAHVASVEQWRRARLEKLMSPDGWLALAGLFWLAPGENSFGSAAANRLVFPAGKAPARAGTFLLENGRVRVTVRSAVAVTSGGRPVTSLWLRADGDSGGPTVLALGSLRFHVIRRGERVGVRLKDRESPELGRFRGIACYPINPGWRVAARFERCDPPKRIAVPNVLGDVNHERSPGAAVFEHEGRTWRLDAIEEAGSEELFFVFGDATNGRGTYGGGRFLYARRPGRDGRLELDFNKAYNPPCAFTPHATCPLPPARNRLALRIEAGERDYGGHGR